MHAKLIALAALVLLAGCQAATWQNPYAAIGPVTVPPPGQQTAAAGYYTPPPATPTISSTNSSTTVPIIEVPAASSRPSLGGTVRTEITPQPGAEAASPSFTTGSDNAAAEPPIRIVEAAPTAKLAPLKSNSSGTRTFPIREPATATGVVTATPTSNTPTRNTPASSRAAGVPAIKFNPTAPPAELSQLPRPPATVPAALPANAIPASPSPALQRTRAFGTGTPAGTHAPAAPPNRLSTAPGMLSDSDVRQATFIETTSDATGQWKSR
jgi:hypothetical protein